MELENKLAAYRAKKKRDERIENLKNKVKNLFIKKVEVSVSSEQTESLLENDVTEHCDLDDKTRIVDEVEEKLSKKPEKPTTLFTYGLYGLGFMLWGFLYYFFITLQFGIIYLIISALFGIYFNTRTGPRDANEISAYSVFNRNCESIDGTLKAEQFEREIRFGGLL